MTAIQPHGYLLSCSLPDWTVHQASANVSGLLGMAPDEVIGRSAREYVADDVLQPLLEAIDLLEAGGPPQHAAIGNIGAEAHLCDLVVHVAGGLVHIELEPRTGLASEQQTPTVVAQSMIARVSATRDMRGFHMRTAEELRQLTGFDRVSVHRFRHDGASEIVAEARADDMAPCLGLRALAPDLPAHARGLHVRSRIHVVPDIAYAPVPVVPGIDASGAPLDLGRHMLRSVAPAHIDALKRMGVSASMSIAIADGDRWWGVIACHHREPRPVPASVRAAADIFGLFVSMRLAEAELRQLMHGNAVE